MSRKPPPFIAPQKQTPALTWETFQRPHGVRPIADVMGLVLLRIRFRAATDMLCRLHAAGCTIRIDDGKLLIRPGDKLSDEDKRMIGIVRDEIVTLMREGAWERLSNGT